MKLVFEVKLGNEAMQTYSDAKQALEEVVVNQSLGWFTEITDGMVGMKLAVRDRNGNTVGSLSIVEEEVAS